MILKKKKKKVWKYLDIDIESMPDEEFYELKPELMKASISRGISGFGLLIVCLILLILGGKFLW